MNGNKTEPRNRKWWGGVTSETTKGKKKKHVKKKKRTQTFSSSSSPPVKYFKKPSSSTGSDLQLLQVSFCPGRWILFFCNKLIASAVGLRLSRFLFPVSHRVGSVQRCWTSLVQEEVTFHFSTCLFLKCPLLFFLTNRLFLSFFFSSIFWIFVHFVVIFYIFRTTFEDSSLVIRTGKQTNEKINFVGVRQWHRLFGLVECESQQFVSFFFCCTVFTFQTETDDEKEKRGRFLTLRRFIPPFFLPLPSFLPSFLHLALVVGPVFTLVMFQKPHVNTQIPPENKTRRPHAFSAGNFYFLFFIFFTVFLAAT